MNEFRFDDNLSAHIHDAMLHSGKYGYADLLGESWNAFKPSIDVQEICTKSGDEGLLSRYYNGLIENIDASYGANPIRTGPEAELLDQFTRDLTYFGVGNMDSSVRRFLTKENRANLAKNSKGLKSGDLALGAALGLADVFDAQQFVVGAADHAIHKDVEIYHPEAIITGYTNGIVAGEKYMEADPLAIKHKYDGGCKRRVRQRYNKLHARNILDRVDVMDNGVRLGDAIAEAQYNFGGNKYPEVMEQIAEARSIGY